MFTLRKPSVEDLRQFILCQETQSFFCPFVGATQEIPPVGYDVDHNRVQLGTGQETFERAKAALRRWEMFNLGWVQLHGSDVPIAIDSTVAVVAKVWGLWLTNACWIVYVREETGPVETFGFAYGTLPAHVERGEERFLVQWDQQEFGVVRPAGHFTTESSPCTTWVSVCKAPTAMFRTRLAAGNATGGKEGEG